MKKKLHVEESAEWSRVKSVKKTGNEPVYCCKVAQTGNFVANGIVVKNCDAMRYGVYSHFGQMSELKESDPAQELRRAQENLWKQNPMQYPGFTDSFGWQSV